MYSRLSRRKLLRDLLILGAGSALSTTLGCNAPATSAPTVATTRVPAGVPTFGPAGAPTAAATTPPTGIPTAVPSAVPTAVPSPTTLRASPTPHVAPAVAPTAVPTPVPAAAPAARVAVARGGNPEAITRAAVDALGGMSRFVKKGDRVVVKPNILTAAEPQYAVTTNPQVVAALVKMCLEAGAAAVQVFDFPTTSVSTAYQRSGIEQAVTAAGARMEKMSQLKFKKTPIPQGRDIKSWPIYEDVLTANVLIDAGIAKTHNLAGLTMGMKNLMGVIQDRGAFHSNIGQRLADLSSVVRPTLTVIDAVRILARNGPTGGRLSDVREMNTVIASTDLVAADSYGATLFGKKGSDLSYLRAAAEMGLGVMDLDRVEIEEVRA